MWKKIWLSVQSNPWVVAFEGGAIGAALDFADSAFQSGHLDFSNAGWHKLIVVAVTGGITAVRLLYRTPPGATPTQSK